MKLTTKNIIDFWFSVDTPIRQFKIKMNPSIWSACQKVHESFRPPSGKTQVEQYRKSDKVAFAEAVICEMHQQESTVYELA